MLTDSEVSPSNSEVYPKFLWTVRAQSCHCGNGSSVVRVSFCLTCRRSPSCAQSLLLTETFLLSSTGDGNTRSSLWPALFHFIFFRTIPYSGFPSQQRVACSSAPDCPFLTSYMWLSDLRMSVLPPAEEQPATTDGCGRSAPCLNPKPSSRVPCIK